MRILRIALTAVAACLAAGCASTSGPSPAVPANPFPTAEAPGAKDDTPQELANKAIVLAYYDAANNKKDFVAASRYIARGIDLHDPLLPTGEDGLKTYILNLQTQFPDATVDVKRVLTADNQVFLHSHAIRTPGSKGFIAGDIFRLENGKIVAQWSVLHPVPEKPHPGNPNGPF